MITFGVYLYHFCVKFGKILYFLCTRASTFILDLQRFVVLLCVVSKSFTTWSPELMLVQRPRRDR